ncbi:hypothetical protein HY642_01085 [Candidatus Woesearchaeota archaeon]|nr:hypothetical protein [Candidatus Woesearchaeota archaeon]
MLFQRMTNACDYGYKSRTYHKPGEIVAVLNKYAISAPHVATYRVTLGALEKATLEADGRIHIWGTGDDTSERGIVRLIPESLTLFRHDNRHSSFNYDSSCMVLLNRIPGDLKSDVTENQEAFQFYFDGRVYSVSELCDLYSRVPFSRLTRIPVVTMDECVSSVLIYPNGCGFCDDRLRKGQLKTINTRHGIRRLATTDKQD